MAILRLNLTGDYGLFAQGVAFEPITTTAAAITAFAAANSAAITVASTLVGLAGAAVTARGQEQAGEAAKANADFQAAQERQNATQARAAGQRTMMENQRQTGLVQSKLQANAAASGAGAADPTVLKLGSDIAGRGEYQALMDLYNGDNRASALNQDATAKELSGQAAQTGADYSAAGTVLGGVGSGFSRLAYTNPYYKATSLAPTAGN